MKLKRYYTRENIEGKSQITIEGEEFHHMTNVMRSRIGDHVELFCGNNFDYEGEIVELNKKSATISILEKRQNVCNPKIQIDLFQALAKGDKLSLVMQKITELGATNMFVFESKFCDVKANTGRVDKLPLVSVSACKQCGRSVPVNCDNVISIKEVQNRIKNYDKFLLFYEAEDGNTLKEELEKMQSSHPQKIAIMIGPEGGFEKSEIEKLKSAGATIVGLGKRILRTETAAIAGVATIAQLFE